VKVGPELSEDKALELQKALKQKLSIEGGFIVSHPSPVAD